MAAYTQPQQGIAPHQPMSRVDDIMNRNVVTVSLRPTLAQAWQLLLAQHPIGQAPAWSPMPRRPDERVIDGRMWRGVLLLGSAMALSALATLDLLLPGGWLKGEESLETARTAAFTVLVLAQLFNAFNARSETASALQGLFANRWLWAAVALGLGLQVAVVELPWLNVAFGTVPLTPGQWGLCALMGSVVLWCGELRKIGLRRVDASQKRPHALSVAATADAK